MELKYSSSFICIFLLFLILPWPILSQGRSSVEDLNSDVYEIDYRGPQTHSSVPPPNRSGGKPLVRRESVMARPMLKATRAHYVEADNSGKKIHG